jgi:hypothetical protein
MAPKMTIASNSCPWRASLVPKQFGVEEGAENAILAMWHAISDGTVH